MQVPGSQGAAVIGQPSPQQAAKAAEAEIIKDNEEFEVKAAEYRDSLLSDELKARWDDLCVLIKSNGAKEAEIAAVTGAKIQNPEGLRNQLLIQYFAEYLFDATPEGQAREIDFIRRFQEVLADQMKDAIPQIEAQLAAQRQAMLAAGNMSEEELTAMLQAAGVPVANVQMTPAGLRKKVV